MEKDIRWEQRFSNYIKALDKLSQSIKLINDIDKEELEIALEEIIKEGLIQRFEYTHELAWNVMKDYAKYQGNSNVGGSRDASREAFQLNLISNGQIWMDMIISRNKTSRNYDEETANEIYEKILNEYYPAFLEFRKKWKKKGRENKKLFLNDKYRLEY